MNTFLIHRLRNAAIAADQRGDANMAELLTEAINELEKQDEPPRNIRNSAPQSPKRTSNQQH